MAFERFMGSVSMRQKDPTLSIDKNGSIRFNKPAVLKFYLHDYKYAIFYFDKSDRNRCRIGIEVTKLEGEKGAYKLRFRKNGSCCDISASAFLRYIGYDYTQCRKFTVCAEEGYLVCDMGKIGELGKFTSI